MNKIIKTMQKALESRYGKEDYGRSLALLLDASDYFSGGADREFHNMTILFDGKYPTTLNFDTSEYDHTLAK